MNTSPDLSFRFFRISEDFSRSSSVLRFSKDLKRTLDDLFVGQPYLGMASCFPQGRVACEGILLRVVLSDVAFLGRYLRAHLWLDGKEESACLGRKVWSFGAERRQARSIAATQADVDWQATLLVTANHGKVSKQMALGLEER